MCIVLSNVEQRMVYELAIMRWRRRERHFAGGHSRGPASEMSLDVYEMTNDGCHNP